MSIQNERIQNPQKSCPGIWNKIMIMDGGMGTELIRLGAENVDSHRLWSAIANINQPEIVVKAHENFINAGSDIIIGNSYQANVPLFMDVLSFSREEAETATMDTVKFAISAKNNAKKNTVICGSIGPLPAAPMSEYNPQYLRDITVDELIAWHEPRFRILYESNCDILGLETIPGIKEIEALFNLLRLYPKDSYLSMACCAHGDGQLNSGESWDEVFNFIKINAPPALKGVGINCTSPRFVSSFGRKARQFFPNLTLCVYPNSGEEWQTASDVTWSETSGAWTGERCNITDYIAEWKQIGFRWFGGCCRVTPDEISRIKTAVTA